MTLEFRPLGFFGFLIALVMFSTVIFGNGIGEDTIIEKPCYDEYRNKIQGLTCTKEVKRLTKDETWLISLTIYPVLILSGIGMSIRRKEE